MKMNVAAAVAGGLIIGAAAMVPLGGFAQTPDANNKISAPTEQVQTPPDESIVDQTTPAPDTGAPITPPSFGPGGAGGDDDEGDDQNEDHEDSHDDGENDDEGDDD